jgi:hypothetical protein
MSTGSCSTQPFGPLGHSGARAAIRPISTPCLRPLRAQQCITNLAPSSLAPCLPPSKARPANLTVYLLLPPCRPGTRFSTPYLCPQPEARSLLSGSPWFSAGLVVLPRCGSFLPRLLEVSTAPAAASALGFCVRRPDVNGPVVPAARRVDCGLSRSSFHRRTRGWPLREPRPRVARTVSWARPR